jgi:RNA polymerase sigma-70 factor (ECF subfamily)
VDLLRRRGTREALNVPFDEDNSLPAVADNDAGDARRDVMALLAQLPDRQRLPIQHVKLEGLSVLEAAHLTGMSASAIKVGVHRGLKALAARIRNEK